MTEQNAAGLLSRYQSGEWSVEQVTIAFLKRATIGQQLVSLNSFQCANVYLDLIMYSSTL
jgi:hypothetical protein